MMHKHMKIFGFGLFALSMNSVLLAGGLSANESSEEVIQKIKGESLSSIPNIAEGQAIFTQCSACHLASGEGVRGVFPPLRNRLASLGSSPEGRLYLKSVLLQGLNGQIDVSDVSYNGYMQSYGSALSDQQISSVLNYVSLELVDQVSPKFKAFSAEEIAATRLLLKAKGKSSHELRKDAVK